MLLITGSTGHLGSDVIGNLLKNGMPAENIAALARNSDKAEGLKEFGVQVRPGNYDNYESLVRAFRNIDTLLFISGSEVDKRDNQHENIINAAAESSVKHILYTSFERKNDDVNSPVSFITRTHIETEKKIRNTGIPFTFLRNALYAEGLPMFLGNNVVEKGIYFPSGNGRVPFASRKNIAEATAKLLAGSGHENKVYNLVNSHNYSFYEIASILSELTGRNLKYFCPSHEEFTNTLSTSGVRDDVIKGIIGWAEGIKQGYFESEYSDLEALLGRKPDDLKTVLAGIYTKIAI